MKTYCIVYDKDTGQIFRGGSVTKTDISIQVKRPNERVMEVDRPVDGGRERLNLSTGKVELIPNIDQIRADREAQIAANRAAYKQGKASAVESLEGILNGSSTPVQEKINILARALIKLS